jgi:hypothetical protein
MRVICSLRLARNALPHRPCVALRLEHEPAARTKGASGNALRDLWFYGCLVPHLYHDDRTHLWLAKGTPAGREAENNTGLGRKVVSMPRLGGLHHRYDLAA